MELLELIERTREGEVDAFLVVLPDRGSRERLGDLVTRPVVPIRREDGTGDHVTLGRGPRSNLRIGTRGVSALHAIFRPNGHGRWELLDNASTNGTFVNGVRLFPGAATAIEEGAVLRFGPRRFLFVSGRLCRILRDMIDRRLQLAGVFVSDPEAATMALPEEEEALIGA